MSNHAITVQEAAKLLKIGPNVLFRILRKSGVLHSKEPLKNTPRLQYLQLGYFKTKLTEFTTGPVRHAHLKPLVTPAGLVFIRELLDGLGANGQVVPPEQRAVPSEQMPGTEQAGLHSLDTCKRPDRTRRISRSF